MARSTKIYVVLNSGHEPVAAFTVKWEMISWLRDHWSEGDWRAISVNDGLNQKPYDLLELGSTARLLEETE